MPSIDFSTLPIFSALPKAEQRELIELSQMETIPRNQVLAREGEEGDEIFALIDGTIDIEIRKGEKGKATLTRMYPGEIFGEMVLLGRKRRVATVRTINEVTIATWSVNKLFDYFKQKPEIGYRFMLALACYLADRLESSNQFMRKVG